MLKKLKKKISPSGGHILGEGKDTKYVIQGNFRNDIIIYLKSLGIKDIISAG